MNAQLKKGVLELIVLESVRKRDMYGYELVEEVSKVVDVNEGTIYPLLKRLTNEHYFETYLRESQEEQKNHDQNAQNIPCVPLRRLCQPHGSTGGRGLSQSAGPYPYLGAGDQYQHRRRGRPFFLSG